MNTNCTNQQVFCPNERPPSFNFQKARWDDFDFYFDSHCSSTKEYSSLSLSTAAAAFFTFLALNAANLPFLSAASNVNLKFGGPLKWKKQLVKDVRLLLPLTEVMKIVRLTFPLPDMPRLSSPRPRLRHDRRLALLSHLNLILILCTLSFVLSLALLPPLLSFPTVPRSGSRLWSSPTT